MHTKVLQKVLEKAYYERTLHELRMFCTKFPPWDFRPSTSSEPVFCGQSTQALLVPLCRLEGKAAHQGFSASPCLSILSSLACTDTEYNCH